jgi:uncharacterized UPF0160 family protein
MMVIRAPKPVNDNARRKRTLDERLFHLSHEVSQFRLCEFETPAARAAYLTALEIEHDLIASEIVKTIQKYLNSTQYIKKTILRERMNGK